MGSFIRVGSDVNPMGRQSPSQSRNLEINQLGNFLETLPKSKSE